MKLLQGNLRVVKKVSEMLASSIHLEALLLENEDSKLFQSVRKYMLIGTALSDRRL